MQNERTSYSGPKLEEKPHSDAWTDPIPKYRADVVHVTWFSVFCCSPVELHAIFHDKGVAGLLLHLSGRFSRERGVAFRSCMYPRIGVGT